MLKLEENILKIISLLMIFGAIIYYFYSLNWLGVIIALSASIISFYFLRSKGLDNEKSYEKLAKKNYYLILIYLLLTAFSFLILFRSVSGQALISPWLVVPKVFFGVYLLSTAFLFFLLNKQNSKNLNAWLLRIHFFLTFAIAAIVYQIGYGFDPFIHQATMELIDKQGYVTPKTPYYLGQYALIVIIHKISGFSIYFLNKFLVPTLAAIFLPSAILNFINQKFFDKKSSLLVLSLLALPFNIFILSTPQNLSYLWLILIIFYSFKPDKYLPLILSLATLAIHPLGGIPVVFFISWRLLANYKNKISSFWKNIINILLWLGSTLTLPLSFTLVTGQSWRELSFSFVKLLDFFKVIYLNTNNAHLSLNFVYLINNLYFPIFFILAISGFFIWLKEEKKEALIFIKTISSLMISLLLSASLSFTFLIDYERDNYLARLPIIMSLFSLPAIIITLKKLIKKIWQKEKAALLGAWIIGVLFITSSLYLSYPRLDAYVNSRGYSVSEADLKAVNSIAKQSNNKYLVLANQQTSVASLKELGFDNYFDTNKGKIFFYPIPTGGELYQYYLKMVNNNPDRQVMEEAMDLAGVKESYLVINKYWWLSNRLIAAAKIKADNYWTINDGEIYIFRFNY